jgi:hypothetical protein
MASWATSHGLSGQNLKIEDIFKHYNELSASLRLYFSPANPDYVTRFAFEPEAVVEKLYNKQLIEVDLSCTLTLLASLEAYFKVDYLLRCKLKKRDPLSRALRLIYKRKQGRARLSEDILYAWKTSTTIPPSLIGDIARVFGFRNWLAHGRWWVQKPGRTYDFFSVYILASKVLDSFPLESV